METEIQKAAQTLLTQRLGTLLPDYVAAQFVGGTHTRRFADNLLPAFSAEQVQLVREQLDRGAGGELKPTASGKRRAHAPYSSAALAANAFGGWLGNEPALRVAGLGGFETSISLEHKLRISYGGGEANLDCVLADARTLVGVESKLTEPLAVHKQVEWRAPYHDPRMKTLLKGGWRNVFEASLSREWTPEHLGVEQLIKHALALNSHAEGRTTHLVYVYWEPFNGDAISEVVNHRAEAARLLQMVEGSEPLLHVQTYEELFAEWAKAAHDDHRLKAHVDQLRARYSQIEISRSER